MPTSTTLTPRQANPAIAVPGALDALMALNQAAGRTQLPISVELLHLRASQINGCSVCVDLHSRSLRKSGESEDRVFAIGAWRDTPLLTDAERAALALTEALTRMADGAEVVPDELWAEVSEHFDEEQRAALVLAIANINLWNRLNAATRQVVGEPQG